MASHALLSPSAAHRWMHCEVAPGLEAMEPEESSVYAEEGTLAHAICEAKVIAANSGKDPHEVYSAINDGAQWEEHKLYQPEMEETSDYYTDVVMEKYKEAKSETSDAVLLTEVKIDLGEWIPGGFGTADALIIADGTIHLIDYKHGKGVEVSAHMNPQMMIYALGALDRYGFEYRIDDIEMTIVQPRLNNTSSFKIHADELTKWGNRELYPAAKRATISARTNSGHATAGPWCRFCKIKAKCRALANMATEVVKATNNIMTAGEIAEFLPKTSVIKKFCTDVEEHALAMMLSGEKVPGYKIVEGRSIRTVFDQASLAKVLQDEGFSAETIYKPRELQTITTLEKVVGKKAFTALATPYIVKPQGKPTLAPESDKRPEFQPTSAEDDFKNIINS